MVTPPVKVFAADNVNVPIPVLVNEPVPLMIPDMVALLAPPKMAMPVSVIDPEAVPVPLLFTRDPLILKSSVVVLPFKSTEAPNAIVVETFDPKPALFPSFNVPVLTIVAPENEFAPLNVQVPEPLFCSVPVPLMTPEAVTFPEPLMIAEVERVMGPDEAAAVELLFTNEPLMVIGSATENPFKSTVAPDAMTVKPRFACEVLVVPKALAFPNLMVPAFTYIIPIKVFAPFNVQVPVPILLGVPELITPVAITSPVPPIVETPREEDRMMAPDAINAVALLFNKDPWTVNGSEVAYPFKSTVAPNEIFVTAVVPKAALLPIFKAPALTVVAPLYVFTPLKIQVPAPDLVNVPVLEIIPETLTLPVPPKIAALVRVIFPEDVADVSLLFTNDPLIIKSSAVIKPFKSTKAFNAIVVAVVVPNAALFPSFNVPALTVVAAL